MRRSRRRQQELSRPEPGKRSTDPLRALLDQAKDARQRAAGAKGLVTLGGEEAAKARRAADQVLHGIDRWKPVSSGFRAVGESLALSEACMGTSLARATAASDNCAAAAKALASLESLLYNMQAELTKLLAPAKAVTVNCARAAKALSAQDGETSREESQPC